MVNILLIDDNDDIRNDITEILELEGFDVLGAPNGEVGIQLARECSPDLIICDVKMPGKDGLEVLQVLQADPSTKGIPFIFLTGNVGNEEMLRGKALGAKDYVMKPQGIMDLPLLITEVLQEC